MGTVCSGRRPSRLADQAGSIPASGVRSSAVPTCTADAPGVDRANHWAGQAAALATTEPAGRVVTRMWDEARALLA